MHAGANSAKRCCATGDIEDNGTREYLQGTAGGNGAERGAR
jgi:hypothetical protein